MTRKTVTKNVIFKQNSLLISTSIYDGAESSPRRKKQLQNPINEYK